MKTGLLYGIVANSKTRVRCIFCGVYIPKANKCIEEHTNGSKHKENIHQMTENGISYKNKDLYCKPCDLYLTEEDSVVSHLGSDDHETWMVALFDLIEDEFMNVDPYLASESDEVHCEVCNSKIYCTLQNIEEHVNSVSHRTNLADKLKPLNAIFPVENNDEVWCKICNVYIDNTVSSILQHIDDDDHHIDWFAEIEELIEGQEVSLQNYLKYELETHAFCNKCQVEIICNVHDIESHVNSEYHLNQFS